MKCFVASCTRKQITLHFKRCGLKKYGKMKCFITSFPVKRPYLGGYCATSGCACTHPSKGTASGSRDLRSHPVPMSVMRNGTFCTTVIARKNAGIWRHFRSGPLPVAPPDASPEIWLCPYWYTCTTHVVKPFAFLSRIASLSRSCCNCDSEFYSMSAMVSSAKRRILELKKTDWNIVLQYRNILGPKNDHCGTPDSTGTWVDCSPSIIIADEFQNCYSQFKTKWDSSSRPLHILHIICSLSVFVYLPVKHIYTLNFLYIIYYSVENNYAITMLILNPSHPTPSMSRMSTCRLSLESYLCK
jgi:hypothetical protein